MMPSRSLGHHWPLMGGGPHSDHPRFWISDLSKSYLYIVIGKISDNLSGLLAAWLTHAQKPLVPIGPRSLGQGRDWIYLAIAWHFLFVATCAWTKYEVHAVCGAKAIALVTGSTGGIGREIALKLARLVEIEQVVKECKEKGTKKVECHGADLTDVKQKVQISACALREAQTETCMLVNRQIYTSRM